jgi:opacity protein-like surface antigen
MRRLPYLLGCSAVFAYTAFSCSVFAAAAVRAGASPDRVAAITDNPTPPPPANNNPEPMILPQDAAGTVQSNNHFEVIGAYGRARLNADDSELRVTLSETDKLVQTNANSWNTQAGQLGLGYLYYYHQADPGRRFIWFKYIEPQFNLYQLSSNSIEGDVWRFNNPNLNDITYDMPIHSTRLMLDAALNIASFQKLSAYVKGGLGEAWTSVGYSDYCNNGNPVCSGQRLDLKTNLSPKFAWEAGAGLLFDFTNSVGMSLEYLYTDLGKVRTSAQGNTGNIVNPKVLPARFDLTTQTVLLGMHLSM